MSTINANLTTSGNSVAVRLPKELLRMSGLSNKVILEAKQGKIIISKPANAREGWALQIKKLVASNADSTKEFEDMRLAANDGLEELEWNGPSFEEWQKNNARLS